MTEPVDILAVVSSCDETACAVVADGRTVLSNVVASQIDIHARYGGVVPEIASRAHIEAINTVIEKALGDFKSLRHRLELIAHLKGVSWYDDSIATTPPSAIAALQAFDAPKIISAGGYDKKLPFDELGRQIARTAKAAILIGKTASKIARAIEASASRKDNLQVTFASSMPEAVKLAHDIAQDGDVVLLSPACASYDMFDNYRQRGDMFAECVRQLKE